jgi:hypothetical protein
MKTETLEQADTRLAMDSIAKGHPIPSDIARRIQERAEEARKRLLQTHGVQNSGVQIIREIRGELPQS